MLTKLAAKIVKQGKSEYSKVKDGRVEDSFSSFMNVEDIPLIDEYVVAECIAENILSLDSCTIKKHVKKAYTITISKPNFRLLVDILI
jgi:hypothetical protein